MSQVQPSQTSQPSSPPSSTTSSTEDQPRQPEPTLRFAETDIDAILIHRFLLKVATPVLRCEVNVLKSLAEVQRVIQTEAALMLFSGDELIGSMGIIKVTWWYGDGEFMTDRWHFVEPSFDGTAASQSLLDEAVEIAKAAGIEFVHQGRMRERHGVYHMWPVIYPTAQGG